MTKFSVKKPYLTIVAIVIVLVIGIVSLTNMQTNLLPDISMPYLLILTTEPGASPEKVEVDVTKPLESALGTISGVEKLSSNSAENYSIVMLEFTSDSDMDSAIVRVSAAINQVVLPEICGTPNIMEISMDMMATMYATVSYEGKDIIELTEFTDEVVVPYFERQQGVASITQMGSVTQTVEVRLNKDSVEKLNDDLIYHTNDKLLDAQKEIEKAEKEITDAIKELEAKEDELAESQSEANQGMASAMAALDQARATKAAYEATLSSLEASQKALEGELKVYADNKMEDTYTQIDEMFVGFKTTLGQMASMSGVAIPDGIEDAVNNPDKLKGFTDWMTSLGYGDQTAALTFDSLKSLHSIVNTRIPQIDTELANLQTEMTACRAIVEAVTEQMKDIDKNYEDAYVGGLNAAAGFGSGGAQLAAGKTSLDNAKSEIEDAKKTLKESKKVALENANLDMLLSLDALSGLIYAQNFAMPAGYVDDEEDNQWLLKVGEEYSSLEDIKSMVLCKVDGVGVIRLSDVADITLINNSADTYAKYNGDDAILLAIYKSSTANTSNVSDNCYTAVKELEEKYPGIHIVSFSDQSQYISMFLSSVLSSILVGALLAILVLALFLKSVKPTLVVAFSIPFSVLFAIIIMYFTGIDINVMSLAGLALAIGMLVDNSIVVIENIYRLRSRGISAPRAAVQGTKQVAGAITASTITTICVFLPMIFTTGMVKDLVVPFALTIAYALTASLLVALTVVPTIGSIILTKTKERKQPFFDKVQNAYGKALGWCLRFKIVPLVFAIVLLVFCIYQVFRIGIVMIPNMSGDTITVVATMPEDTENEEAVRMANEVLDAILSVDGIKDVGAMDSTSSMNMFAGGMASSESSADFTGFMYFVIPDEDVDTINELNTVIDEIKESTSGLECEVSVGSEESSTSFLASGVSVNIYGDDRDALYEIGDDIINILEGVNGLTNVSNGLEDADQAVHLSIDKDKAAKKGLNVATIYGKISEQLTTKKEAATLTLDGNKVTISIIDETDKLEYENLMDLELEVDTMNAEGEQEKKTYSLSDFATKEYVESANIITRENQTEYITISAETEAGENATLLSREIEPLLKEYEAPDGIIIELAGESEEVMEMMQQMLLALALGLLMIYLVMVAQFQSLLSPFIVLFTIPLAFTGGLIGLLIASEEISAMSMMGFMVLMGTVVNNGIVFVDYTNQLRIGGLGKREALIATGKTRMRPIIMTAITTVLAMSSMVFSRDISSSMSKGMAIVISGGLIYSTLMTLFIIPVMYDILYRKQPKVIDVGDDLDDIPNDAEEFMSKI